MFQKRCTKIVKVTQYDHKKPAKLHRNNGFCQLLWKKLHKWAKYDNLA